MNYFMDDKIEYTGKSMMQFGKMSYEFRYVEGHKAGQLGWTYKAIDEIGVN